MEEDGVRLIGVHNRPHGLFDIGHPDARDRRPADHERRSPSRSTSWRPDVVHFHNLHNLGAALIDRGRHPRHPRLLHDPQLLAHLPARLPARRHGSHLRRARGRRPLRRVRRQRRRRRLSAAAGRDPRPRRARPHARSWRSPMRCAARSSAPATPPTSIDIVRQAMPHDAEIWEQVGRDRAPGRVGERPDRRASSARPIRTRARSCSSRPRSARQARINVRDPRRGARPRSPSSSRRWTAAAACRARAAPSPRRDRRRCCAASTPSCCPRCGGTARRWPPPSAWRRGPRCVVPRLGGLPEAIRDGDRWPDLRRARRRRPRPRARPSGRRSRVCSSSCRRGSRSRARFAAYVDELEALLRPATAPPDGRRAAPPAPVAVRWQGDHGLPTSLSIINDRVTRRLRGARAAGRPRRRRRSTAPLPPPADVEVRHQWPPDLSPRPLRPAGAHPAVGVRRDPVRAGCQPLHANVDELWVPSEYVRSMYLEAGVDPERVYVIPNGVDLDALLARGPERDLPEAGDCGSCSSAA